MRERFLNVSTIDKFIGKQIREKRRKRGMTLLEVANKLGLSYQQIQKYEQAVTKVPVTTLYKLSVLYGVKMNQFFDEIDLLSSKRDEQMCDLCDSKKDKLVNVLMIEDNPGDEVITRRALKDFENLNILCVHDGIQILEVLRYKTLCTDFPRPDIIFLDIYIPKRDGISVLKEIKRDEEIQDIPVVVITNNVSSDLMIKAYKNGASGYIRKSFDFLHFKNSIMDCIKYWTEVVVLPSSVARR
jgi:two-component system response regulator